MNPLGLSPDGSRGGSPAARNWVLDEYQRVYGGGEEEQATEEVEEEKDQEELGEDDDSEDEEIFIPRQREYY